MEHEVMHVVESFMLKSRYWLQSFQTVSTLPFCLARAIQTSVWQLQDGKFGRAFIEIFKVVIDSRSLYLGFMQVQLDQMAMGRFNTTFERSTPISHLE